MTTKMGPFAHDVMIQKYSMTKSDGTKETWEDIAQRVATNVFGGVSAPYSLISSLATAIAERKFIPGGRYLYASGRPRHQTQNCALFDVEDSREGWSDLMHKITMSLMTGAGVGVVYSKLREEGAVINGTGGKATGPIALMQMVNEAGRGIMQGGSRRSAIWAGLHWCHADVHKFITLKNWSPEVRALKEKDYNFPAPMDGTNVSVILDDEFFAAYSDKHHPKHALASSVYWAVTRQMLKTAEPGFSIDIGENAGEHLRNACTEITSREDSDICNLGSINMAQVETVEEMRHLVEIATAFLLAGTVYSDVPTEKIGAIRNKNRRLGLGLMGLHEWLLKRGKRYGPDAELAQYMDEYVKSDVYAKTYAEAWGLSVPIKTRAIAPTGTIGILAETTTGLEPIYCVAYKRRYLKGNVVHYQYVIDPTAQRLIESGIPADQIEDAYSLANDVERRIQFQAWMQQYVDHAISSTVNLPSWGSELNNDGLVQTFGNMLMKYLPQLRGITCYPDGARGGQPLTPVKYSTAAKHVGKIFVEEELKKAEDDVAPKKDDAMAEAIASLRALQEQQMTDEQAARPLDICDISKGGTCGS